MKTCTFLLMAGMMLISVWMTPAATRYVNISNPAPAAPYTNWVSAATSIQDAIDEAAAGDLIWVTNGVYAVGGRELYGCTNRVAVHKPVTLQSINGPVATHIVGSGPVGPAAVRCVYLTNGAVLSGFTLTNGATQYTGDSFTNRSGGGVWCESVSAVLSNCVLSGNAAFYGGGAAYSGTLDRCRLAANSADEGAGAYGSTLNGSELRNNVATFMGGGAIGAVLNNCLIVGNSAVYGGGAGNCVVSGGTLVGNSASNWGGGAFYGMLRNCIIYYNEATVAGSNHYESTIINFCCTTPLPSSGLGNLTNAPLFVNSNAWTDLRLQAGSPGIDAGNNDDVVGTVDLDGNPRIIVDTVDMGAYEWSAPPTPLEFTAARWLTNAMELQLTSETNRVIEIHASTNLASWSWLVTLTNDVGLLLYTNTGIAGQPMRFYRAIQLP